MRAVLDANPIIGLSKGGVFHLLPHLFGELHVPEVIWDEIVVEGKGRPGQAEVETAKRAGWLHVTHVAVPARFRQRYQIKGNDAHVVKLGDDLKADRILTDDTVIRRAARTFGLSVTGTAALVATMKQLGVIPSCLVVLDRMIHEGFGIAQDQYDQALLQSGEVL